MSVASWLPVRPVLTPHGPRYGHQTWLDELGVRYVLQSERMGHEVPGMRGVYSHIARAMRKGTQSWIAGNLGVRAAISRGHGGRLVGQVPRGRLTDDDPDLTSVLSVAGLVEAGFVW